MNVGFKMNVLFLSTALLYNFVSVPVATMREQPLEDSEIVSQALFSEKVTVEKQRDDWVYIKTSLDNYRGWVKKNTLSDIEIGFPTAKVNRLQAHVYNTKDTIYGPIMTLAFESRIEVIDQESEDSRWVQVLCNGEKAYIQRGDLEFSDRLLGQDELCKFSLRFLGLPYTWGGRSSFGYDCSGFVQMLYRQMGIYLPRDSKDQMKWEGFTKTTVEHIQPCDLIFFGKSEDKITHVGMYLHDGKFIHSDVHENKPYIRINTLSDPLWNESEIFPYRTFRTIKK